MNATAIIAALSAVALSSGAQAFTQPNSVSPAYTASMAAQAAAGRAASQATIAAPAYNAALAAQAAAGRAASLTTIATPAYNAALAAQAAAGRAASQTTIAAPGGTFAVPNVKATVATGPIAVPKPGSYYALYGDATYADGTPATVTIPANATAPINLPNPSTANLSVVPYPNSNSNTDPTSYSVIIQNSIPPQFNLGLPSQGGPWSAADRQQAQTMLLAAAGILIVGPVAGTYGAGGAALGFGGSGAGTSAAITVPMFGSAAGLSQLINTVH